MDKQLLKKSPQNHENKWPTGNKEIIWEMNSIQDKRYEQELIYNPAMSHG